MSAWFFIDSVNNDYNIITGEDAVHISKSLRMLPGEKLTLCDKNGILSICEITEIAKSAVTVKTVESFPCENEPPINVTLYQALTKSDKMDMIIQKAVQLGVSRIVPIMTNRCVSRPDEKGIAKKLQRWQKIAKGAAMQSRRGIIPKVDKLLSLKEATEDCLSLDIGMVFYEKYGDKIGSLLKSSISSCGIFVGSEGGFDEAEIEALNFKGIKSATLGKRILRTETAPLTALSIIMYIAENEE